VWCYRRRSLRLLPILVCLTALAQTTIPAAEVKNRAASRTKPASMWFWFCFNRGELPGRGSHDADHDG
jgi:hypothetical protein